MAIITVNTTSDVTNENDSNITLREAIAIANSDPNPDEIRFDPNVFEEGSEILLEQGELEITNPLTVNGSANGLGKKFVTVDAQGNSNVFNSTEDTTIKGLTITNSLNGVNGAVRKDIIIIDSTISGNQNDGVRGDRVTISNSTISGNQNDGVRGDRVTISNSTISNNERYGVFGEENANIQNSSISGNNIGIFVVSTATISSSTISNNNFGVDASYGETNIINTTITGNNIGVSTYYSIVDLTNSTVTGNNIGIGKGAINELRGSYDSGYYISFYPSTITIGSSIIAGNIDKDISVPILRNANLSSTRDFAKQIRSKENNIVGNGDGIIFVDERQKTFINEANDIVGTAANPIDPLLSPLQDNGGFTLTHLPLPGSPVINAGSNPNNLTTDQIGNPRNDGNGFDIGAVELFQSGLFVGTSNNDNLFGTTNDDIINGNAGNDSLRGNSGADTIDGGLGNDTIDGGIGDDSLRGSNGNDSLNGNSGQDTLKGGKGQDILRGGGSNDELFGGGSNDELFGDDGDDNLSGNKGLDTLNGGNGNDTLSGGRGIDVLLGGSGDDSLLGDRSFDTLRGGRGNDTLIGGLNPDILRGGQGNDVFVIQGFIGSFGDTFADFVPGVDLIELRGGLEFSDLVISGSDSETSISDTNDNLIAVLEGVNSNSISQDDFL